MAASHTVRLDVRVTLAEAIEAEDEDAFIALLEERVAAGEPPERSFEVDEFELSGIDPTSPGTLIIGVTATETVTF